MVTFPAPLGPTDARELSTAADAALLRRAGLGDGEAFEELFRRHFPATFSYALRMLDGDDAVAQDATQDAWVTVLRNATSFRGEAKVRTWLFTIVAHSVLDLRRHRRPITLTPEVLEQLHADTAQRGSAGYAATRGTGAALNLGTTHSSAEQTSMEVHLREALALALSELPWRQRACWVLFEDERMTYHEIAHVLQTTPTVVRGQLHRARRALAIRMEEWK